MKCRCSSRSEPTTFCSESTALTTCTTGQRIVAYEAPKSSIYALYWLTKICTITKMHSGIRVHLTLRGRCTPYIYPISANYTSNAFFFHAEDGKNIFISLLLFDGGKLATPPPLVSIDRFRNKGQRRFSLFTPAWHAFCGQ